MSETDARKNRIYVIISISIIVISAVLCVSVYWIPLRRLIEGIIDFGKAFAYLVVNTFEDSFIKAGKEVPQIAVKAAELPDISPYVDYVGIDIVKVVSTLSAYFDNVFDLLNFVEFNARFFLVLSLICLYGVPVMLLSYTILGVSKDSYYVENPDSLGEKSDGYLRFIKIALKLKSLFYTVRDYVKYFCSKRYYLIPFCICWLLSFGVFTFVADFFAFYCYFLPSFDSASILYLLLRFLLDLLIVLKSVPLWVLITFIVVTYHVYHRNKALDLLRHNEAKNCGLIKELELVFLIIGESGKGKTTLMTDIVLSLVNIFKTDSLKILYKIEMYFPGFDFASFRASLVPKIANREIFCVPQINDVVDDLWERGELFGYESELYGKTVNLGNRTLDLKTALVIYGKAFLVYQNNNPTVANYSIRFNGEFDDSPFLKLWDGDFFTSHGESYYSHVLDSDIERFGKRVDPNGKFNGSFGWGIWVRTEAAKSYGNQVSNAEYDRKSNEANPLNDLVEYSAKVGRHTNVMIDNKPFFRKLMDEQRASDLTGKIRELCSIISIEGDSELMLAITGYGWLFALRDKLESFEKFYLKYNNVRADFTVALMLPKIFVSFVRLCCERLENVYGYKEKTLVVEGGMAYSSHDGAVKEPKRVTWYQSNMKVYGERFASDCYSGFFTEMQKKCGYGIEDYPTYGSLQPTSEEYQMQKDFFLMKMMGWAYGTEKDVPLPQNMKPANEDPFAWLTFEE